MPERTWSPRYLPFTVSVNANTAVASAISQNLTTEHSVLEQVQLTVPSGHAGLTGIALEIGDVRVVPWDRTRTEWIIADGVYLAFDVGVEIDTRVVARAYNTDVFTHSFYLRFKIRDVEAPRSPTGTAIVVAAP